MAAGKRPEDFDPIIDNFLEHAIGRATSIQRYSTRIIIKPQNVMEHEGSVTFIAMLLSDFLNSKGVKNNTERVLRLAVTHDNDEFFAGDINFEAKHSHGELSKSLRISLNRLSDYVVKQLYRGIGNRKLESRYYALYKEEKGRESIESNIVKMADWIDVVIYSRHEQELGNKKMREPERTAYERYRKMFRKVLQKRALK